MTEWQACKDGRWSVSSEGVSPVLYPLSCLVSRVSFTLKEICWASRLRASTGHHHTGSVCTEGWGGGTRREG